MRIISGSKKGILIQAPSNLPVRPTTDRAKESLFNILDINFNLENLQVLDLFSGTGNISYEFASRGATSVISVDKDLGCIKFIKETASRLALRNIHIKKQDVFAFMKNCEDRFDIIFADAPYALDRIVEIPGLVYDNKLLKEKGWLIVEHATSLDLSHQNGFFEKRKYGQSTFSFFK
ncbi:MAG: RsmD family RNA methyltransferase [Bacteroidia bacterium]|nr:RsmD family RNA methyltransferase [Bacteroidia bacterium]